MSERINIKVNDEDVKAAGMVNGRYQKQLAVFKQLILEEHLLSRFSSYLWSWMFGAVGEVRGIKYKWKEEE